MRKVGKDERIMLASLACLLVSVVAEGIAHYQYVNGSNSDMAMIACISFAALATAICWPVGGFLAFARIFPGSVAMAVMVPNSGLIESSDIMMNSMGLNLCIVLINVVVFFLWCIVTAVKEHFKEKKEVSLTT